MLLPTAMQLDGDTQDTDASELPCVPGGFGDFLISHFEPVHASVKVTWRPDAFV